MIKYFIEREDGMWMTDPDEDGEAWTSNPYKAWAFDKQDNSKSIIDTFKKYGFLFLGHGTEDINPVQSFLEKEELPIYKITEHEFLPGGGYLITTKSGGMTLMSIYIPGW